MIENSSTRVAELQSEKAALEAKIRALSASTGSATASPTVSAAQLDWRHTRRLKSSLSNASSPSRRRIGKSSNASKALLARAKQDTSESPADNGEPNGCALNSQG